MTKIALMDREESYGVVPLKSIDGVWHVLFVRHTKGHWGLPKGHPEPRETPMETASRELFEETHMEVVDWIPGMKIQENYSFKTEDRLIQKSVTYFGAQVEGETKAQEEEIEDFVWLTPLEAAALATFPEMQAVCRKVAQHLLSCPI